MHDNAKVVSSGDFVHVFWTGRSIDLGTGYHVFHARSIDNGATFEAPDSIWQSNEASTFGPAWNNVAIDGSHIHVVFMDKSVNSKALIYLRSVDNGSTFDPVKSIYTCDDWSSIESSGLYITAQSGRVAVAWAHYRRNVTSISLICSISNDNGLSFTEKEISHSTEHYRYYARDLVMTGDNIYVLFNRQDINYFTTQEHLFIAGSSDGGASFLTPQKVNEKAVNDGYYATRIHDNHYSPNIAASGSTAYVVWVNNDDPGGFDGWLHPTLRVRRTTDGGATLEESSILKDYPAGYHHGAHFGQETIALSGTNVVVATVVGNTGTWVWTSRDGTSWPSEPLQLSVGGWWPMIASDPARNSTVHIVNYRHYVSNDGGVSFNGGVIPQVHFTCWDRPQMIVDVAGSVHYVAMSERAYLDQHILYRKIAAPPSASTDNLVLNLVNASPRYDNMQVPATPDLNLSTAMTMELWVRLDTDHPTGYPGNVYFVQKRGSGSGPSYALGLGTPGFTAANNIKCHILKKADTDVNPVPIAIEAPFTMTRGMWTHLAMTFDSDLESENLKLFVNGALVKTADVAGSIYSTLIDAPLIVGDMSNRPAAAFQIDELRIWDKARTQADISADIGRTLSGNEAGLVSYYNFNDTPKDVTGRGNDGVLQFMETFTVRTYSVSYIAGDKGLTYGPSPRTVHYGSYGGSVIAVADEGYHFLQWSDGVTDNPRTDETVTEDIVVAAQFALNNYWLSYNAENGSIVGEDLQYVAHGGAGTEAEAVPAPGYYFIQWSDGVTDNPRTDTDVKRDLHVSAIMIPICINWDADGDDKISLSDIIYYLQVLSGERETTPLP